MLRDVEEIPDLKYLYEVHKTFFPEKEDDIKYVTLEDKNILHGIELLKRALNDKKAIEKEIATLKEYITNHCKSIHTHCKGGGVHISQKTRSGNIDYSMISELQEVDLEKYRKSPISYWEVREE